MLGTGAGIRSSGVDAAEIPRWNTTTPAFAAAVIDPLNQKESKFPFSAPLNEKISVWEGDICKLGIDAIVNSSNETLNEMTGVSGEIFRAAGGQLEDECAALEGCRTGEAKSTRAYNLPCQRIIHTAGPRFNVKYRTAAENALHSCYRNSLQVLVELNLRTVGFTCINSEKKGYPRESAAHIAARTIRRFLEHHPSAIDHVILAVNNKEDLECYEKILPLYFPRSVEEEQGVIDMLPEDTGNEWGEAVSDERKIRIAPLPGASSAVDFNKVVEEVEEIIKPVQGSFAMMQNDSDAQRMAAVQKSKQQLEAEENEREYARFLQRAKAEDFADIDAMGILHVGGTDEMGRTVVSIIAGHFPPSGAADYDRLLLYIIRELDSIVERDYILVYFHAQVDTERQPPFTWIKRVIGLLTRKYKKNVKNLYIVHPSMWMKMVLWFITPFVSKKFWEKLAYIDKLQTLPRFVSPQLLKVPKFIEQYDEKLWGKPVGEKSPFTESL